MQFVFTGRHIFHIDPKYEMCLGGRLFSPDYRWYEQIPGTGGSSPEDFKYVGYKPKELIG